MGNEALVQRSHLLDSSMQIHTQKTGAALRAIRRSSSVHPAQPWDQNSKSMKVIFADTLRPSSDKQSQPFVSCPKQQMAEWPWDIIHMTMLPTVLEKTEKPYRVCCLASQFSHEDHTPGSTTIPIRCLRSPACRPNRTSQWLCQTFPSALHSLSVRYQALLISRTSSRACV